MKKTRILCECAVMLALSIALSYVKIYKMPMGGSVTLLSMLPIMLAGVRHGIKWGLSTTALYALFQLVQSIGTGDVFPYCYSIGIVILCVFLDYLVPFGALGLTGLAHKKEGRASKTAVLCIMGALIVLRFICHFITGVAIWGQWAPEGMSLYLYSLIYNGQYLLPELILTLAGAVALLSVKQTSNLLLESK